MVGQVELLKYIDKMHINKVPHFIVIVGGRGCGKTTLAKYIANKLCAPMATVGVKVDEIREVIDIAYHTKDNVVYCIQDADTMRNESKNAMLKITEEAPNNAYFIMTVQDDSTLLDTIKSRALVMYLQPYSDDELRDYFWLQDYTGDNTPSEEADLICSIATTPYEVDRLVEYGQEFLDYVELIMDNIASVEPANAFKSSQKLAIKNDAGYDLTLFFRVFINLCLSRLDGSDSDNVIKYCSGIVATTPHLRSVMRLGANKQQIYDKWVLDIRSSWYEFA